MRENRMNCRDFKGLVYALAEPENQTGGTGDPDEFLDDATWQAALTHAESCLSCARLLTDARSLRDGLVALAAAGRDHQAPARVESTLVSEFEQYKDAQVMRSRLRRRPMAVLRTWISSNWALTAAASSVLIVLGLVGRHLLVRTRPSSAPDTVTLAQKSAAAPAQTPSRARLARPSTRKEPSRRQRALARRVPPLTEYTMGFLPLEYDGDPADLSRADLVRVELPRSTLAYFGLGTGGDASGTVTADLLIGQDGTPEAVRFLAWNEGGGGQ